MSSKTVTLTQIQVERILNAIEYSIEIEQGLIEDDPEQSDIYEDSIEELREIESLLQEDK